MVLVFMYVYDIINTEVGQRDQRNDPSIAVASLITNELL